MPTQKRKREQATRATTPDEAKKMRNHSVKENASTPAVINASVSTSASSTCLQFSDITFNSLKIDDRLKTAIEKTLKLKYLTRIQAQTIDPLLRGEDLLGKAKTGSGKTLAFLLPTIQLLIQNEFSASSGVGVLILAPTRELVIQTKTVADHLLQELPYTTGITIGGTKKDNELGVFRKGCNILVAAPGRLLDHLRNSKGFHLNNIKTLIFDEADRLLDAGFEKDINAIIGFLPKDRQTILFSATQAKNVQDLARLAFRTTDPLFVDADESSNTSTADGLTQMYTSLLPNEKFPFLFTFLTQHADKKIIVFFPTCKSVKFYAHIFNDILNIRVHLLNGRQHQNKRNQNLSEFKTKPNGTLFTTDVCARGLDIPAVHFIVQFDPPQDPKEYVHRVGRTARAGATGSAIILLLPHELKFLRQLEQFDVPTISKFELSSSDLAKRQIATVKERIDPVLARSAARIYVRFYRMLGKTIGSLADVGPDALVEQFFLGASDRKTLEKLITEKKKQKNRTKQKTKK